MPKCKYCGENITKFDKEICPFCGGKKPLEGVDSYTADITQTINTVEKEKVSTFKQRSKKVYVLLCMFLGAFAADEFYLGKYKRGILRLIGVVVLFLLQFLLYFFLKTDLNIGLSILFSFLSLFILFFIAGIALIFVDNVKDSNGVYLR